VTVQGDEIVIAEHTPALTSRIYLPPARAFEKIPTCSVAEAGLLRARVLEHERGHAKINRTWSGAFPGERFLVRGRPADGTPLQAAVYQTWCLKNVHRLVGPRHAKYHKEVGSTTDDSAVSCRCVYGTDGNAPLGAKCTSEDSKDCQLCDGTPVCDSPSIGLYWDCIFCRGHWRAVRRGGFCCEGSGSGSSMICDGSVAGCTCIVQRCRPGLTDCASPQDMVTGWCIAPDATSPKGDRVCPQ